ncbi:MAG: hypothetical protein GX240_01440 [Candidatus Atribacteria bacterium]|jgi:small-conductance mechanosensitive channel|nr:hypothetical protein [Candidatus Atribacteria bacterium]
MNDQIILLLVIFFIILLLAQVIVRMMRAGNPKYRTPIFLGRMLLGFLLAMLAYLIFLMLQGEDIILKLFGSS